MARRKYNPEQGQFFDSPMETLLKENPKIAFGRVVMPYFFKLDPIKYQGIDERAVHAAAPKKFLPFLLPTHKGKFTVERVALNDGEYAGLVRFPRAFQISTDNQTLKARALDPDLDRRNEAAQRSVMQTFQRRIPQMQNIVGGIRQEQGVLETLRSAARHPGYAHYHAREMLTWATQARYITFQRILDVVGREKEWTPEQSDLAERSLDFRLFFDSKNRVGNWREMIDAAVDYGEQRDRLFQGRIDMAGKIVGSIALNQSPESTLIT